jgi:hypothetical protein
MSDVAALGELINAVRTSDVAKGRTYSGTGVETEWLANEIAEHCKTQGWENKLTAVPGGTGWLVVSNHMAALVEGNDDALVVKVLDGNPVGLKAALLCNGLLALTGVGIIALPLTGVAVWRSHSRKAKIESILQFADQRIQARSAKASSGTTSGSVADRLRELALLRDQGLVTGEEYEAKRQELLKAL